MLVHLLQEAEGAPMRRKGEIETEQITIRLAKADLVEAEDVLARLGPLISTRADVLRLVFRLGLDAVKGMNKGALVKSRLR